MSWPSAHHLSSECVPVQHLLCLLLTHELPAYFVKVRRQASAMAEQIRAKPASAGDTINCHLSCSAVPDILLLHGQDHFQVSCNDTPMQPAWSLL